MEPAVIQQQCVVLCDVLCQAIIGRRDQRFLLGGRRAGLWSEAVGTTRFNGQGFCQVADADARSLQVSDDRDGPTRLADRVSGQRDDLGRLRLRRVREVDAHGVHPGVHHLSEDGSIPTGRADRADDLRPTDSVTHVM